MSERSSDGSEPQAKKRRGDNAPVSLETIALSSDSELDSAAASLRNEYDEEREEEERLAFEHYYPQKRRHRLENAEELLSLCAGKKVELSDNDIALVEHLNLDKLAKWIASLENGKEGVAWLSELAACGTSSGDSSKVLSTSRKAVRAIEEKDEAAGLLHEGSRPIPSSASTSAHSNSSRVACSYERLRKPEITICEAEEGTEERACEWREIIAVGELTDEVVALPSQERLGRNVVQIGTGLWSLLKHQPTRAWAVGFLISTRSKEGGPPTFDLYALSRSDFVYCRVEDMWKRGLTTTIQVLHTLFNASLPDLGFLPEFHKEGKAVPSFFSPPGGEPTIQLSSVLFEQPASSRSTTVYLQEPATESTDDNVLLKLTWDRPAYSLSLAEGGESTRYVPTEMVILRYLNDCLGKEQFVPPLVDGWTLGRGRDDLDGQRVANVVAMKKQGAVVDSKTFEKNESAFYLYCASMLSAVKKLHEVGIAHKDPSGTNFLFIVIEGQITPLIIDYGSSTYIGPAGAKPEMLKTLESRTDVFSGTVKFMSIEALIGGELNGYRWNAGQEWESVAYVLMDAFSHFLQAFQDSIAGHCPQLPPQPYTIVEDFSSSVVASAVNGFSSWKLGVDRSASGLVARSATFIRALLNVEGLFPSSKELRYWGLVLALEKEKRSKAPQLAYFQRALDRTEPEHQQWVDERCAKLPAEMETFGELCLTLAKEATEEARPAGS